MKRDFLILSLFLVLSGCATSAKGPLFTEAPPAPNQKSTLYIFRARTLQMGTPKVKINNQLFANLTSNGYSYAYLSPGVYRISFEYTPLADSDFMTEVEMKEGKNIYLLFSGSYVSEMTKERASEQIKNYRYVDPINKDFKSP